MNIPMKLILGLIFYPFVLLSQNAVEVTDQTVKIGGMKEEELYFGFAEGDKIIFNFKEIENKELKEVEILEYPSNSKFSDYKTAAIENKSIAVERTGIYIFRFKNSALSGRICKIRIERIPANDNTVKFKTAVKWVTRQDTIWNTYTKDVVVAYDSVYIQKTKRELIKIDTIYKPIFDQTMRVHSETAMGETQYTRTTVSLPSNTYYPSILYPYQSTEVISWAYWLGVGKTASEDYEKANKNLINGINAIGELTGYGALAMLASTGISMFSNTTLGDNVKFKFHCMLNGQAYTIDYGDVVSAAGRNEKIKQGQFSIELFNDNFREGIDVSVKIIVAQVLKTWKDMPYSELKVTPRTEKQLFKDPSIKSYTIPVSDF